LGQVQYEMGFVFESAFPLESTRLTSPLTKAGALVETKRARCRGRDAERYLSYSRPLRGLGDRVLEELPSGPSSPRLRSHVHAPEDRLVTSLRLRRPTESDHADQRSSLVERTVHGQFVAVGETGSQRIHGAVDVIGRRRSKRERFGFDAGASQLGQSDRIGSAQAPDDHVETLYPELASKVWSANAMNCPTPALLDPRLFRSLPVALGQNDCVAGRILALVARLLNHSSGAITAAAS